MMKPAHEKTLSQYLDGELSPERRARLEADMADDPELRATLQAWTSMGDMLRGVEVPRIQTPEAGWADVQRALRKGEGGTPEGLPVFGSRLAWAGGMIALVLLASFAWFTLRIRLGGSAVAAVPVEVEWVEAEVPGATPMVYQDEETGLTVIWMVESDETEIEDAGT